MVVEVINIFNLQITAYVSLHWLARFGACRQVSVAGEQQWLR